MSAPSFLFQQVLYSETSTSGNNIEKKHSVVKYEQTMPVPVLPLHTKLLLLVMFPEAVFYNVSMTTDDQTLDSVSPKFEETPDGISHTYISC